MEIRVLGQLALDSNLKTSTPEQDVKVGGAPAVIDLLLALDRKPILNPFTPHTVRLCSAPSHRPNTLNAIPADEWAACARRLPFLLADNSLPPPAFNCKYSSLICHAGKVEHVVGEAASVLVTDEIANRSELLLQTLRERRFDSAAVRRHNPKLARINRVRYSCRRWQRSSGTTAIGGCVC